MVLNFYFSGIFKTGKDEDRQSPGFGPFRLVYYIGINTILFMKYDILTLAEAASIGRLGPEALRKRCENGEAGRKIGKTWVLSRKEAEQLQAEGYRKSGRPHKPD